MRARKRKISRLATRVVSVYVMVYHGGKGKYTLKRKVSLSGKNGPLRPRLVGAVNLDAMLRVSRDRAPYDWGATRQ